MYTNRDGFTSLNLYNFARAGVTFRGNPLFPVAVHHDEAPQYLWKIVEIHPKGLRPFYGVVVDLCDRRDANCNRNKKTRGGNFLIDMHASSFKVSGANKDTFTTGLFRVVGRLPPRLIPAGAWTNGKSTWFPCSCRGRCTGNQVSWKTVRDVATCQV